MGRFNQQAPGGTRSSVAGTFSWNARHGGGLYLWITIFSSRGDGKLAREVDCFDSGHESHYIYLWAGKALFPAVIVLQVGVSPPKELLFAMPSMHLNETLTNAANTNQGGLLPGATSRGAPFSL